MRCLELNLAKSRGSTISAIACSQITAKEWQHIFLHCWLPSRHSRQGEERQSAEVSAARSPRAPGLRKTLDAYAVSQVAQPAAAKPASSTPRRTPAVSARRKRSAPVSGFAPCGGEEDDGANDQEATDALDLEGLDAVGEYYRANNTSTCSTNNTLMRYAIFTNFVIHWILTGYEARVPSGKSTEGSCLVPTRAATWQRALFYARARFHCHWSLARTLKVFFHPPSPGQQFRGAGEPGNTAKTIG
eukprot:6202631-Pleurochrysis_carterae.AAC.1